MKNCLKDSLYELKRPQTLAMTAMLLAIAVVLGFYTLQVTESLKIGFAFLANELTGMMFGPVVGAVMGGLADVLKYIVHPTGPFFPGFMISGMAGGLIYGLILYKRPLSLKRIIAANLVIDVLVNLLLNTYWLTLLYGNGFLALLPVRIVKQIIMLPVEVALFYVVARILSRANLFAALRRTA